MECVKVMVDGKEMAGKVIEQLNKDEEKQLIEKVNHGIVRLVFRNKQLIVIDLKK